VDSAVANQMDEFEQILLQSKVALEAHSDDCDPMWAPLSRLVGAFDILYKQAIAQGTEIQNLEVLKRELVEELEVLSEIDGLTGIWNHGHFMRGLEHELRRVSRSSHALSLMLIEVDFFEEFGEQYGLSAGELCLKRITGQLSRVLNRPYDMVARYAEKQFACLLPETDNAGAMSVAQAIFSAIADLDILHESSEVAEVVTLSMGLVTRVPERSDGPDEFIGPAETLLQEAREAGHNRIMAADRTTPA